MVRHLSACLPCPALPAPPITAPCGTVCGFSLVPVHSHCPQALGSEMPVVTGWPMPLSSLPPNAGIIFKSFLTPKITFAPCFPLQSPPHLFSSLGANFCAFFCSLLVLRQWGFHLGNLKSAQGLLIATVYACVGTGWWVGHSWLPLWQHLAGRAGGPSAHRGHGPTLP